MQKHRGFSIIEILVVLAIIGILTLIMVPAYNSYIVKANRSDAIKSILATQLAEEKYRLNNPTYGSLAAIGASSTSSDGYYTLAISNTTATTYTITATAGSAQSSDTGCTTMTLTYANGTTTKNPSSCWQ